MSKELDYTLHPRVTYMKWGLIYVLIFALLAVIFYLIVGRIHTYSIPVGSFQLSIPYAKYQVGDTVTFTLKNNFNNTVYVTDDCPSEPLAVYRLQDTTWVRIHDQAALTSCEGKDRQIAIPSGSVRSGSFADWTNLFATPGKYRVVAYVDYFDAMPYQDFEVIAKPAPVVAAPVQNKTTTRSSTTTPTATPAPAPVVTPAAPAAPATPVVPVVPTRPPREPDDD